MGDVDHVCNTGRLSQWVARFLCKNAARLADSSLTAQAIATSAKAMRPILGNRLTHRFCDKAINCICLPFHREGIFNCYHAIGLEQRTYIRFSPLQSVTKRKVERSGEKIKIGIVGELSFGGSRPLALVECAPVEHEVHVFDVDRFGVWGNIAERENLSVNRYMLHGEQSNSCHEFEVSSINITKLAHDINDTNLDILIVANASLKEQTDLITLVNCPCIVSYLVGPAPVTFHEKTDFTIYQQIRVGFPIVDDVVYSKITDNTIGGEPCVIREGTALYDNWDVDFSNNRSWEEREPRILFHGRLLQMMENSYLEVLARILDSSSELRFSFMGIGPEHSSIESFFKKRGLGDRVQYCGYVDKSAYVENDFHSKIFDFLNTGRVEADPWPVCGGLSRTECYSSGTPVVHLKLNQNSLRLSDTSQTLVDVPDLQVSSVTADSISRYMQLCLKSVFDQSYFDQVVQDQYAVLQKVVDGRRWWSAILNYYAQWLSAKVDNNGFPE
ncbi:glycosyltransferase family protein [Salidesulfovibrio brasiliensis]|uniref:hypothetical protein n=1 Tax=Salidesulfovibrio brasiliensis TaxID=221711 RepID=UPI000A5BC405|nr:hypothetical protein [Salidesulfovibrio brasiliensis]